MAFRNVDDSETMLFMQFAIENITRSTKNHDFHFSKVQIVQITIKSDSTGLFFIGNFKKQSKFS